MSISYNKSVPVVFLVQEGDELPRAATEEDFLKAGYVPAAGRGHVSAEKGNTEANEATAEEELSSCEDCVFLGEDHILIDLVTLPHVEGILDPFKGIGEDVKSTLDDVKETVSDLLKPLFSYAEDDKAEGGKPATKEKTSPVEDFAGDLFSGAFGVFNTVKNGLSGLLDPIDYTEPTKPSTKASPEAMKEEVPAPDEKPEFSPFEQTVIKQFEELGLGADAKAAMRKSKEFSDFLSSTKPTPEQAKAFADLLKNGKPPFFGG